MNAKEMWSKFIVQSPQHEMEVYTAWQYGVAVDKLAQLTLEGVKTATSSNHRLYEIENEPLPYVGEFSIILNSKDEAVCIIQTKTVAIYSFQDVPEEIAYKEGEGNRTLAYWREVHEEFFSNEFTVYGLSFSEKMLVVCEEFEKVYPI